MDTDTAAKYMVGIVGVVGAVAIIILLLSASADVSLTGQVYSVKTKPVTCGDETCQNWENEENCSEDCGETAATGAVSVWGRGSWWNEDAG